MRVACFFLILASGAWALPITLLKPLYPLLPLVRDGQPQATLVAPRADYAPAALLNARLTQAGGVALPVEVAGRGAWTRWPAASQSTRPHLVALGNINDNELLAVLWGRGYVVADSLYPGAGGYAIRTVHDPFGRGANVLCLNGSDEAGVLRAVEVFCDTYLSASGRDITLNGPLLEVRFKPSTQRFFPAPADSLSSKRQPAFSGLDYFQAYLQALGLATAQGDVCRSEKGNLATVTGAIARIAQTYFWNGDPRLPPLMKAVLDRNRHLLSVVPSRVEMEAASAGHVIWWDVVEELPVWTDQDRLEITNALLADAQQGYEKRAAQELVKQGHVQVVDENHGTNSALNTLNAWSYFERYYSLPETAGWMQVARATFAGQSASFQVLEDASGYLCYCPEQTLRYAFRTGDLTYFQRGIARCQAEYIAACCLNNLGLQTGFGDSPGICQPAVYEALAPTAWFLRDEQLSWVVQNLMPANCGLRTYQTAIPFDLTVPTRPPATEPQVSVFPIYQQTLRKGEGSPTLVADPEVTVGAEWFNKIVFRENWTAEGQYLLLDGAGKFGTPAGYPKGPAGHMHDDVNTLINFTALGRMWLVDHTYSSRSIKDHSGLTITRNGKLSYQVHEAKLRGRLSTGDCHSVTTVFEDFSGADWERTLIWEPGRRFVVLDRVLAREEGDFVARCSYRGLGVPTLNQRGLTLEQQGRWCGILSTGAGRLDLETAQLPAPEEFPTYYPYAEPIVRIFQQDKSVHLKPGEALGFATVLQASADLASLERVTLRDAGPESALLWLHDERGDALYGVGSLPGNQAALGAYRLLAESGNLSRVTRLGTPEQPWLQFSAPVDIIWSPGTPMRVLTDQPVTATDAAGVQTVVSGEGAQARIRDVEARLRSLATAALHLAAAAPERVAGQQPPPPPSFGGQSATLDLRFPLADACRYAEVWYVGGPQGVAAYDGAGGRLWQVPDVRVRVLEVGELAGQASVVAGSEEGKVVALAASTGVPVWGFQTKPGKMAPVGVDYLRFADLDHDGESEILVGATWIHCLDPRGQLKWERYLCLMRGLISGNFEQGAVADFDADGRQEWLALFNWSYPKAQLIDGAGQVKLPANFHNDTNVGINIDEPQCVATVALYGAQAPLNFLVGGSKYLMCYWGAGPQAGLMGGRRAGSFTALSVLPGEERALVLAATDMGAVSAYRAGPLRPDGAISLEEVWTVETSEKTRCLWSGDLDGDGQAEVAVGGRFGTLRILAADTGRVIASRSGSRAAVVRLLAQSPALWVVHADGVLERLTLAP